MDYIEKIHKPSKGVGKLTTVLFMLAILGSPMFSASLSACDITNADIWAGHYTSDASAKNHSPDDKLYEKKNTTVYFYAECEAESGNTDANSEDIRWRFYVGDGNSETEYTLDSTSAGTKTKTASYSGGYSNTGNYTVTLYVDRGHRTGSSPSYTWESASPGDSYSDTCKVTIFDVEITTPSSFPEYVCINEDLSLGSTVEPTGTSAAGTFNWTQVTGPGTVTFTSSSDEDPTFSANQTGNYTAKVEFTIDDSPGGCTESPITVSDTSGTIGVGDVDITGFTPASPYQVGSLSGATSMGSDVVVSYTISPASFVADSAILEVRDTDGTLVHSDSGISHSGGTNTATWSVSTTSLRSVNSWKDPYEIKIRMLACGTECSDTTSMSVIASTASVVSEDSITECMEGRWVTFTATAQGFVSTNPGNAIDFTFNYRRANLTWWTNTDWSFDLVEDNTAAADDVLAGDTDHKFSTPIFVTVYDNFTHSATSNILWIDVYELWIDYFRDNATSKDWKVVVNKNIAYNAIASSDCTNWEWDMADGVPDCWNPTGGDEKVSTTGPSPMVIPNSDLPSAGNWDHFGKAYGTIKVFCEDGEGNNHTFYSTSMYTSDFPAGWGTMKAEVFFDPSATTHPGGGSDNWYYYWKYALFGNVANVSWNATTMYGSTSSASPYAITIGDNTNNDYLTAYSHTAVAGYARPTADGKNRIDLFYSVLTHELQHRADLPFFDGVPDGDSDHLPDGKDPFPALSNGAGYSEYTWQGDWEFNARAVENVVAPASKDWSEGGKQW